METEGAEQAATRVLLTFATEDDKIEFVRRQREQASDAVGRHIYEFHRLNVVAMTIEESEWDKWASDPLVKSIEKDGISESILDSEVFRSIDQRTRTSRSSEQPMDEEIMPYGVPFVQGNTTTIPLPPPIDFDNGGCQPHSSSFKVCIVDSGLWMDHEDIPFSSENDMGRTVRGNVFGLDPTQHNWYNDTSLDSHGTHIAGTLLAQGGNGRGVSSVIPNAQGICLLVARVFGDQTRQFVSHILAGIDWCGAAGADIISLSVYWPDHSETQNTIFEGLWERGIMSVACSGNGGSEDISYPAGYDSVVGVGAVNSAFQRASLSQYNDQVNLAAPGENILSTTVGTQFILSDYSSGSNPSSIPILDAKIMEYSPRLALEELNRPLQLVYCGTASDTCQDSTGKVCVIEWGLLPFWQQARNCYNGGGLIAMIYNRESGPYHGTLLSSLHTSIPTFAISREAGLVLVEAIEGSDNSTLSVSHPITDYGLSTGTSMAVPHVVGVATKLWAARPSCRNWQIREALYKSALDLGPVGRDNEFGHGLVQAEAAYEYLLNTFEFPCGNLPNNSTAPTLAPAMPSSAMPSMRPSQLPSMPPSVSMMPTASGVLGNMDPTACPIISLGIWMLYLFS